MVRVEAHDIDGLKSVEGIKAIDGALISLDHHLLRGIIWERFTGFPALKKHTNVAELFGNGKRVPNPFSGLRVAVGLDG